MWGLMVVRLMLQERQSALRQHPRSHMAVRVDMPYIGRVLMHMEMNFFLGHAA